jgi:hypothetical protein
MTTPPPPGQAAAVHCMGVVGGAARTPPQAACTGDPAARGGMPHGAQLRGPRRAPEPSRALLPRVWQAGARSSPLRLRAPGPRAFDGDATFRDRSAGARAAPRTSARRWTGAWPTGADGLGHVRRLGETARGGPDGALPERGTHPAGRPPRALRSR